MKALSFIGSTRCEIISSVKIRLPDCFADEAFFNTTVVYERCSYIGRNGNEVVYFKLWPDSKINGERHVTNKRLRLTRVSRDGFLILPQDLLACSGLEDSVYLVGMGDYIAIYLSRPDDATAFADRIEQTAAEWLALFDVPSDGEN